MTTPVFSRFPDEQKRLLEIYDMGVKNPLVAGRLDTLVSVSDNDFFHRMRSYKASNDWRQFITMLGIETYHEVNEPDGVDLFHVRPYGNNHMRTLSSIQDACYLFKGLGDTAQVVPNERGGVKIIP